MVDDIRTDVPWELKAKGTRAGIGKVALGARPGAFGRSNSGMDIDVLDMVSANRHLNLFGFMSMSGSDARIDFYQMSSPGKEDCLLLHASSGGSSGKISYLILYYDRGDGSPAWGIEIPVERALRLLLGDSDFDGILYWPE